MRVKVKTLPSLIQKQRSYTLLTLQPVFKVSGKQNITNRAIINSINPAALECPWAKAKVKSNCSLTTSVT